MCKVHNIDFWFSAFYHMATTGAVASDIILYLSNLDNPNTLGMFCCSKNCIVCFLQVFSHHLYTCLTYWYVTCKLWQAIQIIQQQYLIYVTINICIDVCIDSAIRGYCLWVQKEVDVIALQFLLFMSSVQNVVKLNVVILLWLITLTMHPVIMESTFKFSSCVCHL